MNRQVRTRAMLARTSSQRAGGDRSVPALATPSRRLCNCSSIPSPQYRPIARRGAENNAKHWNTRSTRSLLLQPEAWQTTGHGSTAVWFDRHPYRRPSDRYFHRAPILPYFPCSPSVTRSALFPRHITPSRTDRAPGTPILLTASFCFSRTPPPTRCVGSPLQEMQLLPWERGALASLRARVSRG